MYGKNKIINKDPMNRDNPLVSIVVITYNSANFILETLDSAKCQTYKNIELIISDDCSRDETVEICTKWINENKKYFVRTSLVTSDENTGIPGNCNRGFKEARGEWIKFIAGDDGLFEEAVEFGMQYTWLNKNISLFTSNCTWYKNTFTEDNLIRTTNESITMNEDNLSFYNLTPRQQYLSLLFSNKVNAPGMFFKRELLVKVGGFDERLKYIEDAPMFLKITDYGVKIFCMNKLTMKYRIHDSSVRTIGASEKALFNSFYLKIRLFRKLYIYPNISRFGKFALDYEYYRHFIIDFLKLNKSHLIGRSIYFVTGVMSPIRCKKLFLKRGNGIKLF